MDAYAGTQMVIVRQLQVERCAEATAARLARCRPWLTAGWDRPHRVIGWLHRATTLPRSDSARKEIPL